MLTPSSTVGPYFGLALTPHELSFLIPEATPGSISLVGTVTDGEGKPVLEAMVEVWQADENGSYDTAPVGAGDRFTGFGRCHADDDGRYRLVTIRPGRVPAPEGGMQAPHISMAIFGGGLLKPLRTRVYFGDETQANAEDPVLATVEEGRRHLLIAAVEDDVVSFDVRLQGENETPFFEV